MPPKIYSFQDSLKLSDSVGGNRHLLLGNGFSIDWKPEIFQYGSLFERADFSKMSVNHQNLFNALNTNDFEKVILALSSAATLIQIYSASNIELAKKLIIDAELLKDILIHTITQNHPDLPTEVSNEEYAKCHQFLSNFSKGKIYTLNYDLLLYWVLMHGTEVGKYVTCDDGFRKSESGEDYVEWNSFNSQNIYFLHGGLHLFDKGDHLEKFTWVNTGERLISQIKKALDQNKYPVVVTEGDSKQKLTKILHHGYLHKGLRSLENIGGSLFIHGHSLSENDDHFFNLIPQSNLKAVFISLHNPGDFSKHQEKIAKAEKLKTLRKLEKKLPLDVYFYDASSASVWR